MCSLRKWCLLFFFVSGHGFAQWDISALQALGESCSLASSVVDETKLTLTFREFSAELPPQATHGVYEESECRVIVHFVVPPQKRATTFTHRIFAGVEKNASTQVSMKVDMRLGSIPFSLSGTLPAGADFTDEVLLYRAFDTASAFECSPFPQSLEVELSWKMRALAVSDNASGRISLSGDNRGSDSWIETQPCASAAVPALGNEVVR
jgi:hypothetical protein